MLTIGKMMGEAKTPFSKSMALKALALSSSPIITGMIGVSEWPISKPSSLKPCAKSRWVGGWVGACVGE